MDPGRSPSRQGKEQMISTLRSVWIWVAMVTLIVVWLPLLAVIRMFDRDPARMRTGLWFRRLGIGMVKSNPAWRVHLSGRENCDPALTYVVVSNHQSLVDIPLICLLRREMKWIAKVELFRIPFVGWMMQMAGDIPLDRANRNGAPALLRAKRYLLQGCPVMIFPEGTRSPDGNVQSFTDGAFHLAVKAQVPVLPVAVEGSRSCLPKSSWKFGEPQDIYVKVLPALQTSGLKAGDVEALRDRTRQMIIEQIDEYRKNLPEASSEKPIGK